MQNKSGPHLILAGPGTGKTTFLVNKTIELFKTISNRNEGIVICTFTRKATEELITRLYSKLKIDEINKVNFIIGTIHSICYDLLSRYSDKDYSDYQILPEESQVHFIHSKLKNLGYSSDRIKKSGWVLAEELAAIFNKLNEEQVDVSKIDFKGDIELEEACNVYSTYKKLLKRNRLFDFSSIQTVFLEELTNSVEFHGKITSNFKHFFVDEYQDVNSIQNEIFLRLSAPEYNIRIVGDDDQSIYGFRGSSVTHIRTFKDNMQVKLVDTKQDILNENYRSTKNIVEFNNLILSQSNYQNISKNIKAVRSGANHPVVVNFFETELDEVNFIIETIKQLIDRGIVKNLSDIAILYRSIKSHSSLLVAILQTENLAYQLIGAGDFFETIIGREFMALWDFYLAKDVDKKILFFDAIAQIDMDLSTDLTSIYSNSNYLEELDKIFDNKNYFSCIDVAYDLMIASKFFIRYSDNGKNLGKITDLVLNFDTFSDKFDPWGLFSYLNFLKKNQDVNSSQVDEENSIKILTIHQSKGLEFPVVFMPSQIVRSKKSSILDRLNLLIGFNSHEKDEEVRVFYVGCTRAEDLLLISGSKTLINTKRNYEFNPSIPDVSNLRITSNRVDFDLLSEQQFRSNNIKHQKSSILSYNKINLYNICPRAYMYSHVWNLQTVRIGGMEFGRNMHKIIETIIREIIDGKHLDQLEIADLVEENWLNTNFRSEDENQKFKNAALIQIKGFVNNFKDLLNQSSIFSVEDQFNITINDTLITGRFDAIFKKDSSFFIVDFKTGDSKDYSSQLSFYKVCFNEKYKPNSNIDLAVYYLKDGKTEIIKPNDEKVELDKIDFVSKKIKNQDFTATPGKVCKDCAFKNICEFAV